MLSHDAERYIRQAFGLGALLGFVAGAILATVLP